MCLCVCARAAWNLSYKDVILEMLVLFEDPCDIISFSTGLWFQVCPTSPSLVACRKLVPNSRRFLSWTDTTNQKTVRSTQRWILFLVFAASRSSTAGYCSQILSNCPSLPGKIVSMIKAIKFCKCPNLVDRPDDNNMFVCSYGLSNVLYMVDQIPNTYNGTVPTVQSKTSKTGTSLGDRQALLLQF